MSLDNDDITVLLLVDFKKAFDLVNHKLLPIKIQAFAFSAKCVAWFKSYFTQRHQFVSVKGVSSAQLCICSGVPQGSVLGPLLFTMFINDLPESIWEATVDIFADDTTLSQSGHYTNVSVVQASLQLSAGNLSNWSDENRMVLNCAKTKTMMITGKRLKRKINPNLRSLAISVNGNQVKQVTSQKLLGVTLNDKLSFDSHIDKLGSKLAQ